MLEDLVSKLLVKDVKERYSIDEALEHPWFKSNDTTNSEEQHFVDNNTLNSLRQFTHKNAFQKEIYFFIAKISTDDEIGRLKKAFNEFDKENTGTLTFKEISEVFKSIGIRINDVLLLSQIIQNEFSEIWAGLDFHKDGEINYTEFLAATMNSLVKS